MKINRKWKTYWGTIPITIFLFLKILVSLYEELTDAALRNIPEMFLSWFGMFSVYILVFWLGRILLWKRGEEGALSIRIFRKGLSILYVVIVAATMGIGMFISVFSYRPEHIVERNGICMVAIVNSYLQENVSYYEYRNALFRGTKQIGWEDYGNGGGDPLQQEQEPEHVPVLQNSIFWHEMKD